MYACKDGTNRNSTKKKAISKLGQPLSQGLLLKILKRKKQKQ